MAAGAIFYIAYHPFVDFSVLENYNPGKPSIVLDETGKEIMRFQVDRRDVVNIADIPDHVKNAFLAAEDHKFFSHSGISFRGIARSMLVNLYHLKKVQGASTITQQLVKLLFFNSKKNYARKIKEQILAVVVERQFTKSQILEIYLNHICFGHGIYGVEAASQRFWGVSVAEITIAQAATLAGIVRSPGKYCPLSNPEFAKSRRNVVLNSMHKLTKSITDSEYQEAKNSDLKIKIVDEKLNGHLREYITNLLENIIGKKQLYSGGYKIQTTINLEKQKVAQEVFNTQVKNLRSKLKLELNGGLVCLDVNSGAIRSLVGGIDYGKSQFNRAISAKRQMGSIFKPIIYAKAIETGAKFSDVLVDEPTTFEFDGKAWSPNNFNHEFEGPITLAQALSRSNNIVTIKLLLSVGIDKVINLASKFGLDKIDNIYPSLALGCVDATVLQSAAMFNVYANSGVYIKPYIISYIKDELGRKIFQAKPEMHQALLPIVNSQVAKVLSISMARFSKILNEKWLKSEIIGKTGTTNDSRSCWFTGSTPELTTAVYIGLDNNQPMGDNVFAVRTAFPIWLEFNRKIETTRKTFKYDSDLLEQFIDPYTGQKVSEGSEGSIAILE